MIKFRNPDGMELGTIEPIKPWSIFSRDESCSGSNQ